MDLSLSNRQRKITLKAEQTKAVTISTSSVYPELLLLDTKTIQSDKNILKYQGSVLVNGDFRVTTGLQVVSRAIVYPNETGNITFPKSTIWKVWSCACFDVRKIATVAGILSAYLMPPIAAGSSIRIVNEPTSFVTYRIRSRNTSNLPPVIINNMDNTQAWKIHDDIRSIICSSISTLKWLCTTETMHGDPTNEHTALQGYTSGTVRNAEIHGKVEFTGQIVHLDDQKMMRQHFASSQYGFQLKGGAIKVLGSSLSHGTALNVGVSNLTSGTALRILHTNPFESTPIQCLVLNTTSKYATAVNKLSAPNFRLGSFLKIAANDVVNGSALQVSTLGNSLERNAAFVQVDANFQKYGSMFLIEANSLSGGTGLSVVSTSSKSAVRSDIFKVEGSVRKIQPFKC